MNKLLIPVVVVTLAFSTAAFGGGMGGGAGSPSATGGAFGSNAATPGTNSLGTALSSGRAGRVRKKGPRLGTGNPVVDREDRRVARMVHSICRGC